MGADTLLPQRRVVVLGVGNLLWADEGFGVRCVEALGNDWDFPPEVELLDGGTLGLALVPLLLDAPHVPAVGFKTPRYVFSERQARAAVNRDAVVVVQADELAEFQMPGERGGF